MVNPRPYIAKNDGVTMGHREMGVRLLKFIYEYREENGYPPSVREICAKLGYNSTSSGKTLLERTEARGWISVNTKTPRGIKILSDGMEVIRDEVLEEEPSAGA
jgi:SOS-response transcriptional repressor LexA